MLDDVRFAIRLLAKKPVFTFVAVLTLALGIGATTAIVTVIDAAMLRGLPYGEPDRLYHLWETTPRQDYPRREASYPDYLDWQKAESFEGLAAYTGGTRTLVMKGEPERVGAPAASANFFSVLRVDAALGRTFVPGDDVPGAPRVGVLSYGLWQRKFGGDPNVVGQSVELDGEQITIVGVLPASFQFALRRADMWIAYQPSEAQRARRFMHGTQVLGRLKPGVPVEQAEAEMRSIGAHIEQEHNESHAGTSVVLVPLSDQILGDVRPVLMVLLVAAGLVLLIACTNVANLLLVHAAAREKEIAIRAALGADRWRVVRQVLTESVLLATCGGALGLLVARWGTDALIGTIPDNLMSAMPYLATTSLNGTVLVFAATLSLATGILFGLAPALHASRADLQEVLRAMGRTSSSGVRQRVRNALVVSEIALALMLLVGAGLTMKSLVRLLEVDTGFDRENLLTLSITMPATKITEVDQAVALHDQLLTRVESLPGVVGAGAIDILPLIAGNTTKLNVEGGPPPKPGEELEANYRVVDETYFSTMRIPVLAGRPFSSRDTADAPPVVVVNRTLVDRLLPGKEAIGQRLVYSSYGEPPMEIVGVVGDVRVTGLDDEIKPVIYVPYYREPDSTISFVVRTHSNPEALATSIRSEFRTIEPDLAVFGVRTMEAMIGAHPATFMRRYPAILIGVFAAVALILASVGIYGVISYSVSVQTHDIGIRVALGARPLTILRMVMSHGAALTTLGVALGLAGALAGSRFLESILYGVTATDPATYATVAVVLIAVALAACFIPARRATRVDPMVALREQ